MILSMQWPMRQQLQISGTFTNFSASIFKFWGLFKGAALGLGHILEPKVL